MCVFWAARPVMSPWGWCHSGQVLEGTFPTSPGRWQSMIHGEKTGSLVLSHSLSPPLSPSLGSAFAWTVLIAISITVTYVLNTSCYERRFGGHSLHAVLWHALFQGQLKAQGGGITFAYMQLVLPVIKKHLNCLLDPASQFLRLSGSLPSWGCIRINWEMGREHNQNVWGEIQRSAGVTCPLGFQR